MPMSPYVAAIRARIGTDLLLMPAVGLALFDQQDRLLLGRHVDSGTWATIGGAVDPGESPREAALRELQEETGLTARIVGLVDAFGGPDFALTYPNGDRSAYVATVFAADNPTGEPRLQRAEIHEIGWFTAEQTEALPRRADMRQIVPAAFTWWHSHPASRG